MSRARNQLRMLVHCATLAIPLNVLIAWALALWAPVPGLYCPNREPPPRSILGLGPHAEFFDRRCYVGPGFLEAEWRIRAGDRARALEVAIAGPHEVEETRAGFPFLAMRAMQSQFNPIQVALARELGTQQPGIHGHIASSQIPPAPPPVLHAAIDPPAWLRPRDTNRLVPLRPIWPGFLADWLILAACLYALLSAAFFTRERIRKRHGRCPKCAYPLGDMIAEGCPECGWYRT